MGTPKKKDPPTTQGIVTELQKLTNTTSETWIAQKLGEAENAGTIKKILINKDDNPAFAWKNQIPEKNAIFKRPKI